MATIASRLKNDGTLLLNGNFDEVTYSGNTSFASKSSSNTIYTTGEFDEVTFSTSAPVIKNLVHDTQNVTTLTWGGAGVTYTSNSTIAPDGSNTASRLLLSGNTSYAAQTNIPITGGATYTFSFWVKSVSGSTGTWGINWYSGSHHRTTVPITGEWVRQSMTFTPDVGVAQINIYIADNRESLANIMDAHVWGAQLERSSSATIYQPILAANTLLTGLPARKVANNGGYYVAGAYDEYTGAPVVDSGLQLWVDPTQSDCYPGTGTNWYDLTVNNNDGTMSGGTSFILDSFDSNTSSATTDARLTLTTGITIPDGSEYTFSCWVKLNTATSTFHSLAGRASTAPWLTIRSYNTAGSNWRVTFRESNSVYNDFPIVTSPNILNWTHISVTVDSSRNMNLYLNSSYISTVIPTSTLFYLNMIMAGYSSGGNYYPLQGKMSSFMYYNRTLTADEVAQNFNALRRRYGI